MLTLKTSDNGVNFGKAWERFKSAPYFATEEERRQNKRTIGYGHVIKPGEKFDRNITEAEGDALFRKDLAWAEAAVNKWAHPSITQAYFDALVDHVINNGAGSIVADNVANDFDDMVRNGNWPEVRKRLLEFKNQRNAKTGKLEVVPGLVRRTIARQALFDGFPWQVAEKMGRSWNP